MHFKAAIGGFLGASYGVELRDGVLTYTEWARGHTDPKAIVITPTEAQWRAFRQAMDDIRVWEWRAHYPNNNVVDGTQWSLDLAYADHAIKTEGNNNYPDATGKPNGKPQRTEAFGRYLAAIKKLTGDRTFQ